MNENTNKNFPFTIEGESFDSPDEKLTAKSILERAQEKNIPAAQGQIGTLTLKSDKGAIYSGDDWINLSQDNNFSLGIKKTPQVYKFTVNGQKLESNLEKLIALDIIKMGQEKGAAIPGKPENWLLEEIGGKKFTIDEWVDLSQFSEFLLIPSGSTPVAGCDLKCRV